MRLIQSLNKSWKKIDWQKVLSGPGRTHQKLSNEPRYRSPFIGDLTRGTF